MIIKQQQWAWHYVSLRIVQPISALKTYNTTFLLVIIIIGRVLFYLSQLLESQD